MEYLTKLFLNLPKIGWGESRVFNGTIKDLILAHRILEGQGSNEIILLRATHRQDNENILDYKTWLDELTKKESYCAYMLKNYNFINGAFEINGDLDELNTLAKILLKYHIK